MEDGVYRDTVTGVPQGGVISPLLSNIYLHAFDRVFMAQGVGTLVRYADDWVVLCRSEREAQAALAMAGEILAGLGLQLHPEKTRIVDLREGREGFDFLGCHFQSPRVGSAAGARHSPLLPASLALSAGDETHPSHESRS